ncbi:G-protein coupled receptor dmsr-1-like [Apis laboriosa]|uniref:G-protein coupled receptor dmsr-1-like n=1 Tax=Apis laboriosa TaxID=183418 RepID=UPI0003DF599C|nr:sex peptide receptor-like isoform X2 [Apis dorsata]XP_043796601.1 G-protein coupled receptor dmsr-1-like [Apis laboriosa]XP_043796603.1 G-protein coupled receptor dmsr-1-like [Apis laboriosa]
MTDFNTSSNYYVCDLSSFYSYYSHLHGWISLFVCIFGSIANILNILVLTRREMRSPTNIILMGLAVADLLVMIDYIPYAFHFYLYRRSRRDTFTYGWTIFVLFHSNFSQVCHTISICLTLILAVWRYVAVAKPQQNREWCSYRRTIFAILIAYIFCPILCIPLYITTEVRKQVELLDSNGMTVHNPNKSLIGNMTNTTLYFVRLTETAENHDIIKELNFWIYSVVIKLFPCLVLTIVSLKLLQVLLEAKRRRRKLTNIQEQNFEKKKSCRRADKERQTDRTTMMLLAVLLLFLLTELPQGILGLFSVLLGPRFFKACYLMLGDVIDMLTLVNSAINFILYCTMSRQFRKTFNELFCKHWNISKNNGKQICIQNNGNTGVFERKYHCQNGADE